MEKPLEEQCPVCFHSLRGGQIPGSDPPEYYSRIVGIELPDVYDGVLFWECPFCDARFHRFRSGTDLWRMAEPYVRKLPSAEEIQKKLKEALARHEREKVLLGDDHLLINVHNRTYCEGDYCAIHRPSEHPLNKMPRKFQDGLIFRVCRHGVAHPDPDSLAWREGVDGDLLKAVARELHNCCGNTCCEVPAIDEHQT